MLTKVVIPSDLSEARKLEEQLLEDVERCGFDEVELFAVKLALEEAFVNAIKHGNHYDSSKHVTVEYSVTKDQLNLNIADEGDGFSPECVPDPTADENLERPCGRGLMLMQAYMDEVSYNDRGNQVRMVKRKSLSPQDSTEESTS